MKMNKKQLFTCCFQPLTIINRSHVRQATRGLLLQQFTKGFTFWSKSPSLYETNKILYIFSVLDWKRQTNGFGGWVLVPSGLLIFSCNHVYFVHRNLMYSEIPVSLAMRIIAKGLDQEYVADQTLSNDREGNSITGAFTQKDGGLSLTAISGSISALLSWVQFFHPKLSTWDINRGALI